MADFRFAVEDIPTGHIKTQSMALAGWSVGDVLCRPGALSASLALDDDDCTEEMLAPWRTAIYLVRDDAIEWGGILVPPTLPLGSRALSISCFGWLGYWDRRTIRVDRQFTDTEQFDIFSTLVADAQDEGEFGDGYDLGIAVDWDSDSGVLRTRAEQYRAFQGKNLGEALRQLAAVSDGFDFSMLYEVNASTDRIDKTILLHYPRKGRDTGFLFEYDSAAEDDPRPATNVVARGFAANAGDFVWTGDGWGSGADETKLVSPYVNEDFRGVYPPYDAAPSFSSVTEQDVLDENTAAFFRGRLPRLTPVLQVNPDMAPLWGDWSMGDQVLYRCDDGYGSTGANMPQTNRITGWAISDSGNVHQVVLADPDLERSA